MSGQINRGSELGEIIFNIARKKDSKSIVEIGTWNGQGSTKCFLDGLLMREDDWRFFSFEASEEFYAQAIDFHADLDTRATLVYGTIVDSQDVFNKNELELLGELTTDHESWLMADLKNYEKCENKISLLEEMDIIDVLLLDGGEFSTLAEFKTLEHRVKTLILDDTRCFKNKAVMEILIGSPSWDWSFNSDSRNGFAIFKRKTQYTMDLITTYLNSIDDEHKIYIDIGASDYPNIDMHLAGESTKSIFFEATEQKARILRDKLPKDCIASLEVVREVVTPDNVMSLIREQIGTKDITFIDLDIDGYDFFVLQTILKETRPYLIMAEINEKIPPPIKFTVKYDPKYWWDVSHFFGMSISKFYELVEKYEYDIVGLHFNNIFAIRRDKNISELPHLTVDEAYDSGYKNPRLEGNASDFDYNKNVDRFLSLPPKELLNAVNEFFKAYRGRYEIYI